VLDLILRGGAIGTMSVAVVILLSAQRSRGTASVSVFGLLVACYLIISSPDAATLPANLQSVLIAGAILVPLGFAWMMTEILTDPGQNRWPWLILAGAGAAASFASMVWPGFALARGGLVIALYLGLMYLAVISDRDDLVASRRQFRRGFLAVMALLGVTITAVELAGDQTLPSAIYPLQAAAFWALGLLFCVWALRADLTLFQADTAPPPVARAASPDLVNRLNAAMEDGIWQREGLTIGALARELQVPEHRLRATINRDLGFRNFSTFINGFRIHAAKATLADPAQAQRTILEIAYDSGFASLGPFNKAFRASTGQSPREFRARSLG